MSNPDSQTLRLVFVDADPAQPDAATTGDLARATVRGLQGHGEALNPAYTGDKGAAEVFQWLLAAATVVGPFITLTDLSLKLAQLISEIRTLRGGDAEQAKPAQTVNITINVFASTAQLRADAPLSDAAVLAQLLAAGLPEQISLADTQITVAVPPTPPNEI